MHQERDGNGEKQRILAKLDCGLDQSPTVMIGETKATTKLGRN